VEGIHAAIKSGPTIPVKNLTRNLTFVARHGLSDRQVDVYMAGGLINWKVGYDEARLPNAASFRFPSKLQKSWREFCAGRRPA
jgi:hypothetical protein